MRNSIAISAACLLIGLAGCAADRHAHHRHHPTEAASTDVAMTDAAIDTKDLASLAIQKLKPKSTTPIKITSPAFKPGGDIPYKYSDYGEKISPELKLGDIPPGTQSLVLLMEDPDAPVKPFVHWVLFNVPPDRTHLREAMPGEIRLRDLGAANQGLNTRGSVGYFGMRPPYEDPAHHYHFQVFALDRKLDLAPGTERDTVLAAMQGHVLAAGEVVGTYKAAR